MRFNKIIAAFFYLLLSVSVVAQKNINYPDIDKKTYSQYLSGDWKELIKTGKHSLKNDIDFYYLQVRMGIAYYELKKYQKAILFFENARKLNTKDDLIAEYLYYSYLFSGRSSDARKLTKELSLKLKAKIGIKVNPIFSAINIGFRTENFENYKIEPSLSDLLQQNVKKDYSYFAFGAEHLIKNNQKLSWGYSKVTVNTTMFDIGDSNEQTDDDWLIKQNQFYFSYQNQLQYGLNLVFAANFLNIVSSGGTISSGTPGAGPGGFNNTTASYVSNNIIGYFGLQKNISNFKIGINASVSNLYEDFQFQPGIDFTWYPLANTNLYLSTNASYKIENKNNQWENEPVIKQAIGFRLLPVYFEPSITFGNISNYTESNAFIVNNDNDVIKNRFELLAYAYLFKSKLNLFIKYQNYSKTNTYMLNEVEHEINYKNQTITGGIKWNF